MPTGLFAYHPARTDSRPAPQPANETQQKDDQENADHDTLSEGFWLEFFLLKPDRASLRRILDELSPGDLLQMEEQTRELFARSVRTLKRKDKQQIAAADLNALDVCRNGVPDKEAHLRWGRFVLTMARANRL